MKLREYERDPALMAAVGDEQLVPPADDELLRILRGGMLAAGSPAPVAASPVYMRWKPGTASTVVYEISFEDARTTLVTLKAYATAKARHLAEHLPSGRYLAPERLRPSLVLPDRGACLLAFPADRVLRGLGRALDGRRLARHLEDGGLVPDRSVRRRTIECATLRYKPERRAVIRLSFKLRGERSSPARRTFGIRVLPPEVARRVTRRRRTRFPRGGPAPELVLVDEPAGVLLERWIDGEVPAPDRFEHARTMGALLADLHSEPVRGKERVSAGADWAALFAVDDQLARSAGRFGSLSWASTCWVHGDLHPDQVVLEPDGRARLLDLDALRPGAPQEDLASWIADELMEHPPTDFDRAAGPLLDAYAAHGGVAVPVARLRSHVALGLVARAAAAIRRLEHGAVAKAVRLVETALALDPKELLRA